MKKWLMAVLFGTVLVLGACGGGGDTDGNKDGNNVSEAHPGEEVYKKSCSSCHGSDLGGGVGDPLTDVGSKYSADEIEDIIQNGKGNMQPVNVSDEDRKAVAEWLATQK